jgi:hypothetical protein
MNASLLKKYTFFWFIFTAGALCTLVLPVGNKAAAVLTLAYFLGLGWLIGDKLFPGEAHAWQGFLGTLILSASLTVVAGLAYFFYKLNVLSMAVTLILTPAGILLAPIKKVGEVEPVLMGFAEEKMVLPWHKRYRWVVTAAIGAAMAAVVVILAGYGYDLLKAAATDMSMRSPWDVVPRMFFLVFFLAVLGCFAVAYSGLIGEAALLPATVLALLAVSVSTVIYSVGFGFDPFIHQATETVIQKMGEIQPKPFYYIGQYAIVVLLSSLLKNAAAAIDPYVVSVAFALVVPVAGWSLKKAFNWPAWVATAASMTLLLLPLSPFIDTTPQGLADILALMTFFISLPAMTEGTPPRPVLLLLAATAAIIHPLAGIPLFIFLGILFFLSSKKRKGGGLGYWLTLIELAVAGSVAVPLVFLINARLSGAGVTLDGALLRAPAGILEELRGVDGVVSRQFNAVFDFVYSWRAVREIVIAIAGLLGIAMLYRRTKTALAFGVGFLVFMVNYALLKTLVRFPFLIEYERSNYADRLFDLALLLLAPAAAYAFGRLLLRAKNSFPALKIGIAVLIAVLATSSLYLAYPRRDKYESSRGWSTSAADVKAVRLIADDANDTPYVTLANQSVSAAAIRELGFEHYYRSLDPTNPGEEIFFYPIPTGGPLYALFLEMSDANGATAPALKAMDLTGTDTAYFIITNYWWHAQKIISAAKRQADAWWSVDDKDFVFKYTRQGILKTKAE